MTYLNTDDLARWIAMRTEIDEVSVRVVLQVEWEYQALVGIAQAPLVFLYYGPDDLRDEPRMVIDCERISTDVERLSGGPSTRWS